MFSHRLAFIVLGGACVAAAAGGGYLAMRQNTVPAAAVAATVTPTPAPSTVREQTAVDRPAERVQEPESVVDSGAQKLQAPKANPTPQRNDRAAPPHSVAKTTATSTIQPPPVPIASPTPAPVAALPPPVTADSSLPTVRPDPHPAAEAVRAPEPPQPTFEELVVSANSVIGLTTVTRLSSETAKVEDRVEGRVTRDVSVGGRVAIPAGSLVLGTVTVVDRGGKFKQRARLGIRFLTLVLADGTRLPNGTETIDRYGEAPGTSSTQKVGVGAVGGAILGAILGGAKGAAIGATAGAGGGAAVVAAGDRSAATLPAGTPMTVRILSPLSITIEK